ncbi:protein BOLA4, chloroplastic/mitochondrial-like [Curcuma longa]|uniref:protein BOLA4, chloroplastic/mitochondrial-like n=1 Tax=Curcuma longa TaxID=136217 RepID=UPI003D9E21E6
MAVTMSSSSFSLASIFLRRISAATLNHVPPFSALKTPLPFSATIPTYHGTTRGSSLLSNSSIELCRRISFVPLCGHYLQYGSLRKRGFCSVRATEVSDSGSIDSPMIQAMEKKIKEQLNADAVVVKDAYGDGRHVSIDVVSKAFEGQSSVNRQRMVYKAIWEELQSTVHAVDQMTTKTPSEINAEK